MDKQCRHCGNTLVNVGTVGHIDHRAESESLRRRLATLEAENKALREALEPLAHEFAKFIGQDYDDLEVRIQVSVRHIRRAAALLEPNQ